MFQNPEKLIDEKIVTPPDRLSRQELNEDFIQQNGIDVDVATIIRPGQHLYLANKQKKTLASSERKVGTNGNGCWRIYSVASTGSATTFQSSFWVEIPEGMCGWLIGRSTLNRHGILIRSGLYDSGFKGYVGGTIYPFNDLTIEYGTRIAQLVIASADTAKMYQGQYQAESDAE